MARKSMSKQLSQNKQIDQNAERTDFLYNRQNEMEVTLNAAAGTVKEHETTKVDRVDFVALRDEVTELATRIDRIGEALVDIDDRLQPWWKKLRK